MLIVLRKVKMPFELPRLRIESGQRIAVEIVARAPLAAIRWRRIARGPKRCVRRGIVSPRDPSRCATRFPRVAFPGFISRLAGSRHRVKTPFALARCGIVGVNEAANPVLPPGHSDKHQILDHHRPERDAVSLPLCPTPNAPPPPPALPPT